MVQLLLKGINSSFSAMKGTEGKIASGFFFRERLVNIPWWVSRFFKAGISFWFCYVVRCAVYEGACHQHEARSSKLLHFKFIYKKTMMLIKHHLVFHLPTLAYSPFSPPCLCVYACLFCPSIFSANTGTHIDSITHQTSKTSPQTTKKKRQEQTWRVAVEPHPQHCTSLG